MAYRFIRYVREGAAAAILQRDGDPAPTARPVFDVGIEVGRSGGVEQLSPPPLQLNGPMDVTAVDPRQIGRRVPEPNALTAPAGEFPFIEFARPDFPWLFSPYAANAASDTVTPWLCLVVVEQQPGVAVTPGAPNFVLHIEAPATLDELPSLSQAAAWAHVQLDTAAADDDVASRLGAAPTLFRSRLVSPRLLEGRTTYWACLVPSFEGGRLAALGRSVDGLADSVLLAPAWQGSTTLPLDLPAFDAWQFTTDDSGTFEDLVRRLTPRALPASVGTRTLDASGPGGGIPAQSPAVLLDQDGAMGPSPVKHTNPPGTLVNAILARLDAPSSVTPPSYGRWHAAAKVSDASAPAWLKTLNSDPVRRVAAGLGAQVVQAHQEEYMAAIWDQAGEVLRANQLMRFAELARESLARLYVRRFVPLAADGTVLLLSSPAAARIRTAAFTTLWGAAGKSCLSSWTLTGAFRKAVRPNGPVGRRLRRTTEVVLRSGPLVQTFAGGGLQDVAPPAASGAVVAPTAELSAAARAGSVPPDPNRQRLAAIMRTIVAIAGRNAATACVPLDPGVATAVLQSLDPRRTIGSRAAAQVKMPQGVWQHASGVGPVMIAPQIRRAMWEPLSANSQEWIMPGLSGVLPNTMTIAQTNRTFVEAYFVGLNEEIGREMLWRGFPTDQRGTVFDRFWRADVVEIDLILRGDLVRRFPAATVFLQQAVQTRGGRRPDPNVGGTATELPLFDGQLGTDLRFIGFGIPPARAKGDDPQVPNGYYVTLQEQPGSLRFGPPSTVTGTTYVSTATPSDATAQTYVRPPFRLYVHASQLLP
jgi:hypothetical protein